MLTVNGLVIRERASGENDKILSILSDTEGLVEVCAKGVKKANAKNASVSQCFCYAKYCVTEGRNYYILNSAEPIRMFYDIRLDIEKFALASYFCELLLYTCPKGEANYEVLRLILNTLHFLSKGTRTNEMLKSVFEMRLMSEIGLVPNLIGCCECYRYLAPYMQFDLASGKLYCEVCCPLTDLRNCEQINMPVLHALRLIALSDMAEIFKFKISKLYQTQLSRVTERYVLIQLGRNFKTLDFYKSLINKKD